MNHTILLDGYNIIFKKPLWRNLSAEAARLKLQTVADSARYPVAIHSIIIVYDAPESSRIAISPRCTVYYAAPSADSYIQQFIRNNANSMTISLITNDRELIGTAKSHAVQCYSVKWFLDLNHSNNIASSVTFIEKDKKSPSSREKRKINDEFEKRWCS